MLTVEGRLILCPDRFQDLEGLVGNLPTMALDIEGGELLVRNSGMGADVLIAT